MMVPETCLTLGRELALHENWKAPVKGGGKSRKRQHFATQKPINPRSSAPQDAGEAGNSAGFEKQFPVTKARGLHSSFAVACQILGEFTPRAV